MENIGGTGEYIVGPITPRQFRSRWFLQLTDEILLTKHGVTQWFRICVHQGRVLILVAHLDIGSKAQGVKLSGNVSLNDAGKAPFEIFVSRQDMQQEKKIVAYKFPDQIYREALNNGGMEGKNPFNLYIRVHIDNIISHAVTRNSITPEQGVFVYRGPLLGSNIDKKKPTNGNEETNGTIGEEESPTSNGDDDGMNENIIPSTVP